MEQNTGSETSKEIEVPIKNGLTINYKGGRRITLLEFDHPTEGEIYIIECDRNKPDGTVHHEKMCLSKVAFEALICHTLLFATAKKMEFAIENVIDGDEIHYSSVGDLQLPFPNNREVEDYLPEAKH